MKFSKPTNGVFTKFFDTYVEAVDYYGSNDGIVPVVSLEEWNKIPKDYKGYKNGQPYVLYSTIQGTVYGLCAVVNEI